MLLHRIRLTGQCLSSRSTAKVVLRPRRAMPCGPSRTQNRTVAALSIDDLPRFATPHQITEITDDQVIFFFTWEPGMLLRQPTMARDPVHSLPELIERHRAAVRRFKRCLYAGMQIVSKPIDMNEDPGRGRVIAYADIATMDPAIAERFGADQARFDLEKDVEYVHYENISIEIRERMHEQWLLQQRDQGVPPVAVDERDGSDGDSRKDGSSSIWHLRYVAPYSNPSAAQIFECQVPCQVPPVRRFRWRKLHSAMNDESSASGPDTSTGRGGTATAAPASSSFGDGGYAEFGGYDLEYGGAGAELSYGGGGSGYDLQLPASGGYAAAGASGLGASDTSDFGAQQWGEPAHEYVEPEEARLARWRGSMERALRQPRSTWRMLARAGPDEGWHEYVYHLSQYSQFHGIETLQELVQSLNRAIGYLEALQRAGGELLWVRGSEARIRTRLRVFVQCRGR